MAGSRELRNLAIDGTPALRGGAVPRRVAGASYRWTGGARYENAGTAQDLAWAAEAAQASTRATAQDEVSDVDMANADGEAQTDSDDMSEIIYVAGANVPGSPDHGASDHGDEDDDEAPKCNDFAYIQAGTEHGEPRRCTADRDIVFANASKETQDVADNGANAFLCSTCGADENMLDHAEECRCLTMPLCGRCLLSTLYDLGLHAQDVDRNHCQFCSAALDGDELVTMCLLCRGIKMLLQGLCTRCGGRS
ncbi:hypothetical protein LTR02_015361 [Friedmanniomyces endolithicus]|nr:hypothetical protein LTR94_017714 [Friedmanniomyces endolithicus]KAK0775011.1 hypothetical protein LTR59_014685 [Friedmanniomyces endolithicus]KAK0831286.1 hypothetical protein LTR03_015549 [Friedmanniomyces endolithicus]KAK0858918.1 hypothetical protein LTS02_009621 [Friedmanniomyces endolithicus]KAK0889567.1 hypothetical protein LTR02_015361 [Friedmanniomyces endolithicus]